jgi:hypothetical protein
MEKKLTIYGSGSSASDFSDSESVGDAASTRRAPLPSQSGQRLEVINPSSR